MWRRRCLRHNPSMTSRPTGTTGARPATARALGAIDRLPRDEQVDEAFLREYCGPTVAGVTRICEWVD